MENSELIKQYIDALDVSIDELEPIIKEISAKSFEDRLNETSDEHERINISNSYAYILTSLCFGKYITQWLDGNWKSNKAYIAYLKSRGVDTNNHPIIQDLTRVKSYMGRAKEALNPQKGKFVYQISSGPHRIKY